MKLKMFILITALALTWAAAIPADEQSNKCALCSDFVKMVNANIDLEIIPNKYNEFFDEDNLASCLASCNSDFAEGGLDTNSLELNSVEDRSDFAEGDTVELLSMVGCSLCTEIIQKATSNLFTFDYDSIRHAVSHSCSLVDGIVKTARCKLFVKAKLTKIVEAIFRYRMNPMGVCVKLAQC